MFYAMNKYLHNVWSCYIILLKICIIFIRIRSKKEKLLAPLQYCALSLSLVLLVSFVFLLLFVYLVLNNYTRYVWNYKYTTYPIGIIKKTCTTTFKINLYFEEEMKSLETCHYPWLFSIKKIKEEMLGIFKRTQTLISL